MALRRGRVTRSRHIRRANRSRSGFASLSQYYRHKGAWRERTEVDEALQAELVRQVKATPSVPVGPSRKGRKGGETRAALIDPSHKRHFFQLKGSTIMYGADTLGARFNRKTYAHGVGSIPTTYDTQALARAFGEAVLGSKVPGADK